MKKGKQSYPVINSLNYYMSKIIEYVDSHLQPIVKHEGQY